MKSSEIKFSYPILKLQAKVKYEVIEQLSSFEKLLFEVIKEYHCLPEGLENLVPIEPRFLRFLVLKHLRNGNIITNTAGYYVLSPSGSENLRTLSNRIKKEIEFRVIFDPIQKLVLPDQRYETSRAVMGEVSCDKIEREEIASSIPVEMIKSYIKSKDETVETGVHAPVFVTGVSFTGEPVGINICLSLLIDFEKNKRFLTEIRNGIEAYPLSFDTLCELREQRKIQLTSELDQSFEHIVAERSSFFHDLILHADMEFSDTFRKEFSELTIGVKTYDFIIDKDHAKSLKRFISMAEKELYIASGWIKLTVVQSIIQLLKEKLQDPALNIHLLYGYSKNDNASSSEALQILQTLQKTAPNLHLHNVDNEFHCKGIVVDDKLAVIGSYNWLSNSGKSSKEWSFMLKDAGVVTDMKKRFFDYSISMAKKSA